MMRHACAGLAIALCLGGALPAHAQPADRLGSLAGTWTCRGAAGDISTLTFTALSDAVIADETGPGGFSLHDRYQPDGDGWRVERDYRYGHFSGRAGSWNDSSWIVDGRIEYPPGPYTPAPAAAARVIRYELLDANTLSRTFGPRGGDPQQGEVCARGSEPPDPSLCVVHDVPPVTLRAALPEGPPPAAVNARINGTVRVLVQLDADSKVVGTSVVSSPSPLVNADAMRAARLSVYRTAYHDCKPVPSKYIFSVDYMTQ